MYHGNKVVSIFSNFLLFFSSFGCCYLRECMEILVLIFVHVAMWHQMQHKLHKLHQHHKLLFLINILVMFSIPVFFRQSTTPTYDSFQNPSFPACVFFVGKGTEGCGVCGFQVVMLRRTRLNGGYRKERPPHHVQFLKFNILKKIYDKKISIDMLNC